ncbi:E3 ubiquitin-protein ligase TRIM31 [Orchesella cincta]|uniref:E3 ubiquitin-protein ligase TRIM31 n=1 Tax=Orchesella cincta TaxID=48709 RepID=A0A1D2NE36_ORCCI|nr:E3 ubiquitin-protein ligase TRIM31 [Orchesella cincta]
MEVKPTARDQQILDYLKENYSCKICNNILIQCLSLSCGHNYCGYCLDMLGGMTRQCPQCLLAIKRSSGKPNRRIDQEIDELIHSCSEPIQKAYAAALDSRFKKSLNRSKNRKEQHQNKINDHYNDESTIPRSLDEICNAILVNNVDMNQEHSVAKALKSARRSPNPYRTTTCTSSSQTPRRAAAQMKDVTQSQKTPRNNSRPSQIEIDVNKVDMLFGIYDHVLNIENEPNKEMAGGDFAREEPSQTINMDINPTGMKNFAIRNEIQLASLIKETEDIIQLDDHIQKWTSKMNDALTGKDDEENKSIGIADEKFDKNMHKVDDELWRASSELLKKLRGMQQQRKSAVATSSAYLGPPIIPPPPPPRSGKLDLETVSDDSDVEEYETALEFFQESLKVVRQSSEDAITNNEAEKNHNQASSASSKRKSKTGDSIEESGNCYVKENIEFITQMRKYKAALMKIQNHEVETAAEIKELLPTESFPSDENRYGHVQDYKCGGATTPRRLSHMSPIKPSRHNHKQSFPAKLPSQMPRRPMTASYDMPSISKQIMSPAPTKQYMKRGRANPLYTAR